MIWHAMRVKSGKETVAAQFIAEAGGSGLVPIRKPRRRGVDRQGRAKWTKEVAIIPGYCFAGFFGLFPWYELKKQSWYFRPVEFDGRIAVLRPSDIVFLHGLDELVEKLVRLEQGDRVRYLDERLSGRSGVVTEICRGSRVKTALVSNGNSMPIETDIGMVEKVA